MVFRKRKPDRFIVKSKTNKFYLEYLPNLNKLLDKLGDNVHTVRKLTNNKLKGKKIFRLRSTQDRHAMLKARAEELELDMTEYIRLLHALDLRYNLVKMAKELYGESKYSTSGRSNK